MKLRKKKGFTLIELLIVVAIIAILAAIAIPQFSQYRIKGYNSSATADCRNARTAEESFFADWQVYASSGAAALPGATAILVNQAPNNSTGAIAANSINGTSAPSAAIPAPGFSLGISQNVGVGIQTSAAGGSFSMACKNASGDRCFGLDSDTTAVYWVNGQIGQGLTVASLQPATASTDDFVPGGVGNAGLGICNGLSGGGGQIKWVAL